MKDLFFFGNTAKKSVFFDHARGWFRPRSTVLVVSFDRARGMFRPCASYVSTVLVVCFDPARCMFRPCSRYVSTEVDRARSKF